MYLRIHNLNFFANLLKNKGARAISKRGVFKKILYVYSFFKKQEFCLLCGDFELRSFRNINDDWCHQMDYKEQDHL